MNLKYIRNFAIISHVDHGKSTLADRLMEVMGTVASRDLSPQLLDDLSVEQAHGVTVKARPVQNHYRSRAGLDYQLNLIDTPGHVDFHYEVTKSLAATDGVLLLVDATRGVQAQTVANWRLAHQLALPILPVINKVDLASARVAETQAEIYALDPTLQEKPLYQVSAKTGQGVLDLVEGIIQDLPSPTGQDTDPVQALVFDSTYDSFQGVIAQVRLMAGVITTGTKVKLMATGQDFVVKELGVYQPQRVQRHSLQAGEVGYLVTAVKDPHQVKIGDTVTTVHRPAHQPLPGYQPSQPVVYAGIYPVGSYADLQATLAKLVLNDSSLLVTDDYSAALGPGFRLGFLGIFHLQIIKERLENEFHLEIIVTAPNVGYQVDLSRGTSKGRIKIKNPADFPDFDQVAAVYEPMVAATILTPSRAVPAVMKLAEDYRGSFQDMGNQGEEVSLVYHLPLAEIAYDFFDHLKSLSHGYASLTTVAIADQVADLVRVDLLINYARVDSLTFITHRSRVEQQTQNLVHLLKGTIPRRLYPMPVQAVVEGQVVARIDVPPLRKNAAVNGKSRSISKKQALLHRQSQNNRRAAQADIDLPQAVFNTLLSLK